jgi:hypothetical protein
MASLLLLRVGVVCVCGSNDEEKMVVGVLARRTSNDKRRVAVAYHLKAGRLGLAFFQLPVLRWPVLLACSHSPTHQEFFAVATAVYLRKSLHNLCK